MCMYVCIYVYCVSLTVCLVLLLLCRVLQFALLRFFKLKNQPLQQHQVTTKSGAYFILHTTTHTHTHTQKYTVEK